MTEDEMVGWHHRLNGYEFEQALGVGEGEGSLVCCSPWGHKESGMTEQLRNNNILVYHKLLLTFILNSWPEIWKPVLISLMLSNKEENF